MSQFRVLDDQGSATHHGLPGSFSLHPHPANTITFWVLWVGSLISILAWHLPRAFSGWKWTTGDWLINFEGGFIRRGIVGESILLLTPPTVNVSAVIFAIQVTLLLIVYGAALVLFLTSTRSNAWLMLSMSPAFLMFAPLSLEGSLRKEMLAVCAAALFALAIRFPQLRAIPWFASALFVIGALSHEAVALALPGLLILLNTVGQKNVISKYQMRGLQTLMVVASVFSVTVAVMFSGTRQQAELICGRVQQATESVDICTGAIDGVGLGLQQSLATVSALLPTNIGYVGLIALSLIPFAILRAGRAFWLKAGLVYAFLSPLFVVAWDYGRWIFLATSILTFIAFNDLRSTKDIETRVPWLFAYAYILLWKLPTLSLGAPPLLGRIFDWVYVPFSLWVAQQV